MSERSYNQYCGIAYALDIIGERWTLLIIRELILGPRRFKDLMNGLPGIGTNLLSDRLKKLVDHDIIRQRELPPPAASTVYELTDLGRELQPALEKLGNWGTNFLGKPDQKDIFNPRWLLLAMKTSFLPEKAKDVNKIIEFRIDDENLYAHIRNGVIETRQGSHPGADLVIESDSKTFMKLISSTDDTTDPKLANKMILKGETELFERMSDWFDA